MVLMSFQRFNLFEQARHVHRFGIEVIAARGDRLFPVTRHGICRERNNRNALGGRVGFDSLGSLFAADVGQ